MIFPLGWIDGDIRPVAALTVSALDRTLLYGLGAFETVRLHGGRPFLFDRHLARLRRSLASVGLAAPDALARLPAGVPALAAAAEAPSALCRVTVTAGAAAADGAVPGTGMRVIVQLRSVPAPSRGPVAVGVAPFAHDSRSPLAGVKSTSYLSHYLQRDEAESAGRLDDLMVDTDGNVTEGTVSNAFAVRGGELLTPPVSAGILPGVTRGVVLELAAELGIPVRETPLPVEALARVEEFFLTGAGKCLVGVDEVAGHRLPVERPVTRRLRAALIARIAATCGVSEASICI
ncbi:MAG TPA: aminotransferase class IV [Planctomycetota bacterium]|nr:aminotransferase class IV [Planctomycetota bacterium]